MSRDFLIVWEQRALFLEGFLNTFWLAGAAAVLALAFGALLSTVHMAKSRGLRLAAQWAVDGVRCIPFLLLAYLVYYGLPSFGLRLDNLSSGLFALALYNTAYVAEILRGAWASLPRDHEEAGRAFGFAGARLYRRIVLPPTLLAAAPMLGNQLIQIIKDSAFLMIIAVPELTHAASSVQSNYYIPFAAFIAAVALYWALCATVELGVRHVERLAELRR